MQTSYNEQPKAMAGMKGSLVPDKVTTLYSTAAIAFGLGVSLAATAATGKLPSAATDITDLKKFRGIALQQHTIENLKNGLAPSYPNKHPMSIMEKGEAWVVVGEDVAVSDTVFCSFTGADAGKFFNDAQESGEPSAATAAAVPNARFKSASITIEGGVKIALLELY